MDFRAVMVAVENERMGKNNHPQNSKPMNVSQTWSLNLKNRGLPERSEIQKIGRPDEGRSNSHHHFIRLFCRKRYPLYRLALLLRALAVRRRGGQPLSR